MKTFYISDILKNDWSQLKADQAAILLVWRDKLTEALKQGKSELVGFYKSMLVRHLLNKGKLFNKLNAEQVHDIADDLNFIHDHWYSFHVTFIKTKQGTFYRPDFRLASFTFWQLVMADAEYSKFLILNYEESKEQYHALDRLVAIIYQPKPGYFTDTTIEDHAAVLPKGLTFELKYLILHTYSNIRKWLVSERCPTLFNAASSKSKKIPHHVRDEEQANAPTYTGKMWQQMLFDLSETPAFSGLENAKNARMFDALDYLEKKAIENKKRKQK